MKWVEFSIEAHPEAVDAVANVFQEYGNGGVAIEQPIQADDEGEEPTLFVGLPLVRTYLPMTSDLEEREKQLTEALWHLQAFDLSPIGPLQRREIEEEDWAHGWKEHFHPLKVGRVVIKPSWRTWAPDKDEIVVELDPGMAFGTGLHPTTRLTLAALQDRVRPGMDVLDLGCGSGILAIPAARLGARVLALDTSEVAVQVTLANALSNGVADQVSVLEGSIDRVAGETFDVILANIIASVLIDLAPSIHESLVSGGTLLASGIIEPRVESVRQAFRDAGLILIGERHEDDWWLIEAQRPA